MIQRRHRISNAPDLPTPPRESTICEPPAWFVALVASRNARLTHGPSEHVWVCQLCGLTSEPGQQAMVECLASSHDAIQHGGSRTAQITTAAASAAI